MDSTPDTGPDCLVLTAPVATPSYSAPIPSYPRRMVNRPGFDREAIICRYTTDEPPHEVMEKVWQPFDDDAAPIVYVKVDYMLSETDSDTDDDSDEETTLPKLKRQRVLAA